NDDICVSLIKKVAKQENLYINQHVNSLKFGEDFGWYSQQYKSAIFGLGAGEEHPALHHANYDFPDELIATGIQMFKGMIAEVLDN
ncbi:MAG TPA: amidohydrolase, partial [Maribacter sp.]|nr:amidohydrolase [Maribacter sp.]